MKNFFVTIVVFALLSMNIAYAMDFHADVASDDDLQISQNFDMAPDDNDSSNTDADCQIHCGHAGAHNLFTSVKSVDFKKNSIKHLFPDPGMHYSLDHEPPFQPPIA